jgi:hypothetical protein
MSAQSYEDADRTRRIQEEIRRKIAERRSGRLPPALPSTPSPRPVAPPLLAPRPVAEGGGLRERLQRKLMEMQQKAEAANAARRQQERQEEVRRQQALERAAAEQRKQAAAAQKFVAAPRSADETKQPLPALPASKWRTALRDPASVRRAMVLREILGPPVGLR